jgi:hypothetical protein
VQNLRAADHPSASKENLNFSLLHFIEHFLVAAKVNFHVSNNFVSKVMTAAGLLPLDVATDFIIKINKEKELSVFYWLVKQQECCPYTEAHSMTKCSGNFLQMLDD